MKIIKHSGDIVDFDPEKLKTSLIKSGAGKAEVHSILHKISSQIYEGISTKDIYKMAYRLLKKTARPNAARYNLRNAIQLLGPEGFFFEKYIARVFEAEGYETKTSMTLIGKCVSHEVDAFIKKGNVIEMIECKFHQRREAVSDVKVPMYILSRFNDLKVNKHSIYGKSDTISKCWIATNNRFTSDAIDFALCYGIVCLGWDYPPNNNLRTKNDENCLYPVTCLTSLTVAEKEKLLILNIILAKDLLENSQSLTKIGLSENKLKTTLIEVAELCKTFDS
ncbi:MAG TPA: ATP cone domain-containing protein [Flavobacterium sp.]|nr:ATP cone domain-containing protein [Flavobacterium sp.]